MSIDELYDGDPNADLKIISEREMGLYLVEPPRRHRSEVTGWKNQSLHFHLWRPINETRDEMWFSVEISKNED